ncbi:hypothetical protein FRB90_009088 [Tulasnella sp. 427]|nr:hypothetical protein FRB90_009088 [Tulasnella sp. 427]
MRSALYTSFFACISVALAATESGARLAYPSHRMIRKRLPSPLMKELHATSEDPATGKDLLSPITDNFNSPDTMSDFLDKGHLTGPGSILAAEKIIGPDSLLDADKLHLSKGDKGIDLSVGPLTLPIVSSVINKEPVTNLIADATKGAALNGINLRHRDALDLPNGVFDVNDVVASAASHSPESSTLIEAVKEVHLGGRLRGRKVKRLSIWNSESVLPLEQEDSEISPVSVVDATVSRVDDSSDPVPYGSPYLAARRKQAGLLHTSIPRA